MKRLIIICEGETEKEFCDVMLKNYFSDKNITVYTPLIKTSHGGIVSWGKLKNEIETHLRQDTGAYVTTFIDLYRLPSNYPNYNVKDPDSMQVGMKQGIDTTLSSRFIPYIQRHEFECFIFASLEILKRTFAGAGNNFLEIEKVIAQYSSNLEDINDGSATAPSDRLKKYLPEYEKGLDGAYLADEIGLLIIREKCPRFNNWIAELERIV
ncbi:MAG: DUF4276 family protein [Prevotella sp.]|jgi:hypothetical protein|nr:DUF4276 family protein [Prevotella sp.]